MNILAWLALGQGGPVIDVEAGFDGQVFQDAWARITVVIQNPGEAIEAPLRITAGGIEPTQILERIVTLPARAKKRFTWDVWIELGEHEVRAEFAGASRSLPIVLSPGAVRAVHVGGWVPAYATTSDHRLVGVRVKPELLPDALPPLLAVDVLVFPEPVVLEPEQEEAVVRWVETGGRLVWSAGRGSAALQRPFWREMCPADLGRPATVSVSGATLPLIEAVARPGARATIELGGRPAGFRIARGRGEIHFLAFPAEGIDRWVPPAALGLEEERPRPADSVETFFDEDREWVFDARNLRERVIRRESLKLPWAALAAAGVGVYALLIGPGSWIARRRRKIRGPMLFVGLTALACAGVLAWAGLAGPPPRVVHWSIAEEGLVQTMSLLRAEAGEEYRVEAEGAVSSMPDAGPAFSRSWAPRNEETGRVRVPLPRRTARILWTTRATRPGEIGVRAVRSGGTIEIRNAGRLSLAQGVLVDGSRVWALPDVPPRAVVSVPLSEAPVMEFARWAGGDEEDDRPNRRRFRSGFERQGLVAMSLMGASSYGVRMGPRGIDMSRVLKGGGSLVLAHFEEDVSGLRSDPAPAVESKGLLRVVVEDR